MSSVTKESQDNLEELFLLLKFGQIKYEHLKWISYFDEKVLSMVYKDVKEFYNDKVKPLLLEKEQDCFDILEKNSNEPGVKEKFIIRFFLAEKITESINKKKIDDFDSLVDLFYSEDNKANRKKMTDLKNQIFKSIFDFDQKDSNIYKLVWKLLRKYAESDSDKDELFKNNLVHNKDPQYLDLLNKVFSYDEQKYGAIQMQLFDGDDIQKPLIITVKLGSKEEKYETLFSTDMFWKLCESITKDFNINTDLCEYKFKSNQIPFIEHYSKLLSDAFPNETNIQLEIIKNTIYTSNKDIYCQGNKIKQEISTVLAKKTNISKILGDQTLANPDKITEITDNVFISLHKVLSIQIEGNDKDKKLVFQLRNYQEQLRARFFFNIRKDKYKSENPTEVETYENSLKKVQRTKELMVYWYNTFERIWAENPDNLLIFWVNTIKKIHFLKKKFPDKNKEIESFQTVINEITNNIKNDVISTALVSEPRCLEEINLNRVTNLIESPQCFLYFTYCYFKSKLENKEQFNCYFAKIKEQTQTIIKNILEQKSFSDYFNESLFIPDGKEDNFYYHHFIRFILDGEQCDNKNELLSKLFAEYTWNENDKSKVDEDILSIIKHYNANNESDNVEKMIYSLTINYKLNNTPKESEAKIFIDNNIKNFNPEEFSGEDSNVIYNLLKYVYKIFESNLKEQTKKEGKGKEKDSNLKEIVSIIPKLIIPFDTHYHEQDMNEICSIEELYTNIFNDLGGFLEEKEKVKIKKILEESQINGKNIKNEKDIYIIEKIYEYVGNIIKLSCGQDGEVVFSRFKKQAITFYEHSLVKANLTKIKADLDSLFNQINAIVKKHNDYLYQQFCLKLIQTSPGNKNHNEQLNVSKFIINHYTEQLFKWICKFNDQNSKASAQDEILRLKEKFSDKLLKLSENELNLKVIISLIENISNKFQGLVDENEFTILDSLCNQVQKLNRNIINEENIKSIKERFEQIINSMSKPKHKNNHKIIINLLKEKNQEIQKKDPKIIIKEIEYLLYVIENDNNSSFTPSILQHLILWYSEGVKQNLWDVLNPIFSQKSLKGLQTILSDSIDNLLLLLLVIKELKLEETIIENDVQDFYRNLITDNDSKPKEFLFEKLLTLKDLDENSVKYIEEFIPFKDEHRERLLNAIFDQYPMDPNLHLPTNIKSIVISQLNKLFESNLNKIENNEDRQIYPKKSNLSDKVLMYIYYKIFLRKIDDSKNLHALRSSFLDFLYIITHFTEKQHNKILNIIKPKFDSKLMKKIIKMFEDIHKSRRNEQLTGEELLVGMFILVKCGFVPRLYYPILIAKTRAQQIIKLLFNDAYLQYRVFHEESSKCKLNSQFSRLKENEYEVTQECSDCEEFLKELTIRDTHMTKELFTFITDKTEKEKKPITYYNCLFKKTNNLKASSFSQEEIGEIRKNSELKIYTLKGILIYNKEGWDSYMKPILHSDEWYNKNNVNIGPLEKIQEDLKMKDFTTILFYTAVTEQFPQYFNSIEGVKDYGKIILETLKEYIQFHDNKHRIGLFSIIVDKINISDDSNFEIYKKTFDLEDQEIPEEILGEKTSQKLKEKLNINEDYGRGHHYHHRHHHDYYH